MNTKKITALSLAVALSMVLSFVEALVPPFVAVPGVKIGLANVVTVFLIYIYGWREAGCVSLIRVTLSSLLFGSPVSFIYSLAGAVLSFFVMVLIKRVRLFSVIGVSVLGGVFHNVGQVIAACLIMENAAIAAYLVPLLISGTVAGIAVGTLAGLLTVKLRGKV